MIIINFYASNIIKSKQRKKKMKTPPTWWEILAKLSTESEGLNTKCSNAVHDYNRISTLITLSFCLLYPPYTALSIYLSTTIYLLFYENAFLKNRKYIFLEYTGIALKIFYITKEASANFRKLVTFIIAPLQLN